MKAVRTLKSQEGFSLIELMVVVAIIGILTTIAIPNFQKFQAKTRMTEGKGYLASIYAGETSFYAEWNQYADCLDAIGVIGTTAASQKFQGVGVYGAGWGTGLTTYPPAASGFPKANCGVAFAVPTAGSVVLPAQGDLPTTSASRQAYIAGTAGLITNGKIFDQWTINEANLMTWAQSGL